MSNYAIKQIHEIEQIQIKSETLAHVLSKILCTDITHASYQTKQLQGGTLGDVRLVTGMADAVDGIELPYKVVLKIQKKWERPGDVDSWRREYDLYVSEFKKVFTDSLRWPECYHAEITDDETYIWMEYIDGISGNDLTIETLEQTASELGRFQGRLYQRPELLRNILCLGDADFMEREYQQWNPETVEYRYLYSDECTVPEHLRRMLIDTQQQAKTIFTNMKHLPVVLCHRDFWIENIFLSDKRIILIDWDCAGWGLMGEDIASLIADDTDVEYLDEYYRRLVTAYCNGLSEYMDIAAIENFYIGEMIIIKFGYRILQKYMFADSSDVKNQQITALQKIYEIRGVKDIIRAAMKEHGRIWDEGGHADANR